MTDRHIWHAEQTPDGARVMSGFQTVCRVLTADMIHPGAVAMDIARDIAERHNHPLVARQRIIAASRARQEARQ